MTPSTSPTQVELDRRAGQSLMATWRSALEAKDAAKLATMVTDDVVFLPPGAPPIRGRLAVEAMYNAFLPQFTRVEQTSTTEELAVIGEWAFAWGTETLILFTKADAPPLQFEGKGMTILKRQPDGTWRIARAINNSTPKTVR